MIDELQEQFKKTLKRRLENPHVISAKLSGQLKDCLVWHGCSKS